MKPGLCKKSGYSLKDTFIAVIKCLVLTWAFFLIGINVNDDKVKAAAVEIVDYKGMVIHEFPSLYEAEDTSKYTRYRYALDDTYGNKDMEIKNVLTSSNGYKYSYIRFKVDLGSGKTVNDAFMWLQEKVSDTNYDTNVYQDNVKDNGLKSRYLYVAFVIVNDSEPKSGFLPAVKDNGQTLSQYGITSFNSKNETIFYTTYELLGTYGEIHVGNDPLIGKETIVTISVGFRTDIYPKAEVTVDNTSKYLTASETLYVDYSIEEPSLYPLEAAGYTVEIYKDDKLIIERDYTAFSSKYRYANTSLAGKSEGIYKLVFKLFFPIGAPQSKYTLYDTWYDWVNKYCVYKYEFDIVVDKTKPVINAFTIQGNDGAEEGYTNQVDVTFTGDMSDLYAWKYTIYDGNNQIYENGGTLSSTQVALYGEVPSQGLHTLTIYFYDLAGNVSTAEASITYDSEDPVINSFSVKGNSGAETGYTKQVGLTISSSYTETNVKSHSVTGGAAEITDNPNGKSVNLKDTEGSHTLTYTLTDKAGNIATKTDSIIYDKSKPVIGDFVLVGNSDADEGYSSQTTLKFKAVPSVTETNKFKYRVLYTFNSSSTVVYAKSETNVTTSTTITIGTTEGTYAIGYYVYDKAGNSAYKVFRVTYDKTDPTGASVSCSAACDAWTNKTVTATMSGASDTNFKDYRYSTDGTTFTSSEAPSWSSQTNITVYFRAYDKAGNYQDLGSKTVKIDKTKPTVDDMDLVCESGNCNGWTKDNVVLNLSGASDTGGSELANYQYSYDQSTWSEDWDTGSTSSEVKGTWSADRNNTVYFRVYDNAGNYSDIFETSVNIMIDKQAPNPDKNITIINSSNGEWTNQNVTIVVSGAVDDKGPANANSGIAYYQFKYDTDSNWRPKSELGNGDGLYNESKGARDVWSAERDNTVSFRACDNAGNCTDYSKTTNIKIDKSAPTGMSVSCTSSCSEWTASDVTVSASSATDAGVGSFTYKYKIDSGSYTDGAAIKVSTNSGTIKQATVKYKVCDSLGNCSSEVEKTVKIDKSKPVISLKADGDHNFKITVTDTGSGATSNGYTKKYYMSLSDNAFEEFASSSQTLTTSSTSLTRIAGTGKYYIYVDISGIQDPVGNLPDFASTSSGDQRTVETLDKSYKVQRFEVEMDNNPEKDPVNDVTNSNGSLKVIEGNNIYQIQANKYLILTVNKGTNQTSLATLVAKLGLTLVTKDDPTTQSKGYENIIIKSSTENTYKAVTIAVVYNAPRLLNSGTVASSYTIEQGEELDNFGLSFIGSDGSEVDVETLITLNGEKVSKLDTGVAGVYNVLQVAKDKLGRTTTIRREVIVEASVVEEEKSLEIEEVIEKQEIMMPIKAEEPAQTQTSVEEVKEVNTNKVEMRIEKKLKVRGYKKKKEIKRPSKESFTFKLFSKYFFKVYDG